MMSKKAAREHLVKRLKEIKAEAAALSQSLTDQFMETYESDATPFWASAERASIEVDTWPAWKRGAFGGK